VKTAARKVSQDTDQDMEKILQLVKAATIIEKVKVKLMMEHCPVCAGKLDKAMALISDVRHRIRSNYDEEVEK
jgi:uncharacterized protein with PIN domain